MKKRTKTKDSRAVGNRPVGARPAARRRLVQRRVQDHFCSWCAENFARNTAMGLDSKFWWPCAENKRCPGGRRVHGIIVLDGNRSKVMERIERILVDAYPNKKLRWLVRA